MTDIDLLFPDWSYGHPKILYGLIRSLKPQIVVEIGGYIGYGTAWMAQALVHNGSGMLYCIESFVVPFRNVPNSRAQLMGNLHAAGVAERVTLIEGDSQIVELPGKIDFAYVDGWHSFKQCKADFDRMEALGASCICLDDTMRIVGPRMVLDTINRDVWNVLEIFRDGGLTICIRREEKSKINFSQEIPGHPGVDLTALKADAVIDHLQLAASKTGLDYSHAINWLV